MTYHRSMKVTFAPMNLTACAGEGETILDAARRAGAPLGNACGALGICGRCVVIPLGGGENLTPRTERERVARSLAATERLACQAVVLGDCLVTTTYWGHVAE